LLPVTVLAFMAFCGERFGVILLPVTGIAEPAASIGFGAVCCGATRTGDLIRNNGLTLTSDMRADRLSESTGAISLGGYHHYQIVRSVTF
jgi:hypothetical protein